MTILTSDITSDSISLSTFETVDELILSYGKLLKTTYTLSSVNDTNITITKENLGLDTLDNTYFKVEVLDALDNSATAGLYTINIINELESKLYNANTLKQELDNLNYYDGIVETLTTKMEYLAANDMFSNFMNFLENKLNGNNILLSVSGQNNSKSCN